MLEYCHNVDPVLQPVPARNPGGDCFACAMMAGLRFLYPERQFTLEEVWEMFVEEYYDGNAQDNLQKLRQAVADSLGGKLTTDELTKVYEEVKAQAPKTTVSNTWSGFYGVLSKASQKYGKLEITWDMVEPHFDRGYGRPSWSYAWRYQDLDIDYARRLEGWLRGGWVAWTEVRLDGGGPFEPGSDGSVMLRHTDHFVLVDGVRYKYVETRDPETNKFLHGTWKDEIHVVDSSGRRLTGWYETRHFTRSYGASSWWLARRDQR